MVAVSLKKKKKQNKKEAKKSAKDNKKKESKAEEKKIEKYRYTQDKKDEIQQLIAKIEETKCSEKEADFKEKIEKLLKESKACLEAGNIDEADKTFKLVLKLKEEETKLKKLRENTDKLIAESRQYYTKDELDKAEQVCKQALELKSEYGKVAIEGLLGQIAQRRVKLESQSKTDSLIVQGEKHLKEGELTKAKICLQKALLIYPDYTKAKIFQAKLESYTKSKNPFALNLVDIVADRADLKLIVEALAQKAHLSIIGTEKLTGEVSLFMKRMPVMQILETVVKNGNYYMVEKNGLYKILAPDEYPEIGRAHV